MWPSYTDFLLTNYSFDLWQPLKFFLLSRLPIFFLLKTRVNADYVSMLFMALWEDIKIVKHMEVSAWGLQLIQFDFDLRQSFLWRKDMNLIYPVYFFMSVFSTSIVSERWTYRLCEKFLLFSQTKHTQKSMHLHRCSCMLCKLKRMSNVMCKGCKREQSILWCFCTYNNFLISSFFNWLK